MIFSREHRYKLAGIECADTITVDGHKQLYTPMGLGLILFKDPDTATYIRKTANYVIRHDSPDLGKFTLEGSRPATSLHLHATLHLIGRDGIESLVTRSATLVRQMATRLELHPSYAFQVLHEPATNILLYRYIPTELRGKVGAQMALTESEEARVDEATRRIQTRQSKEGEAGFVSRTKVFLQKPYVNKGLGRWVDAFRVVIANPLTKWDDVEGVVAEQLEIGAMVEEEMELERPKEDKEGAEDGAKVKMWIGWPLEM
jgi:glutamate decarboxylase